MHEITRPEIPGTDSVEAWFGSWPCFHDAEVSELHLNGRSESWMTVHVEWSGKRGVVTFRFTEIVDLELGGFSGQNVIGDLDINETEGAVRLSFSPIYGVGGHIDATEVSVEVRQED